MYPNPTEPPTPATTATSTGREPTDRWEEIFHNPDHTGQTWACVAAAIDHADTTLRHAARTATDPALLRGGALWRQAAAASYQMLYDTDAYRHLDADPPGQAVADPTAARTWLSAPVAAAGLEATTVADKLDVDEDFLLDDEDRPARISRLLQAAQHVGVLRSDGANIQLWHIADDNGDLDGHRLAVCRDDGVVLASTHLSVDDIAGDTLTGIEAATTVLTQTAVIANEVLTLAARAEAAPSPSAPPTYTTHAEPDVDTTPPPVPPWVQGFRPRGGRGFPPPGHGAASSPPQPPAPSPPRLGRPPQPPAR